MCRTTVTIYKWCMCKRLRLKRLCEICPEFLMFVSESVDTEEGFPAEGTCLANSPCKEQLKKKYCEVTSNGAKAVK